MVIGFDGSRAFVDKKTGTENYSFQLLKALSKIDKNNEYIVYMRPGTTSGISSGTKWPENFKFQTLNYPRLWTQVGLGLQTFKDKLDVLFVPAHTLPLVRRSGLKTVVTVHDLGSEFLPKTHQLKQRLYLSLMQKYQLKTATKLIAVSKATKNDLIKKMGILEKKISVVYEGFDQSLFKPKKTDTKVDSLRYYLFVGTIQPRKNLERIIRAFSQVATYQKNLAPDLVIAGSKGWLSDEIYALPKKLGIEDKVKFLGYVPDEKLPSLYSQALALVFPSLFEGFGLTILEAQACGCPVITSNLSSMAEVAGKGAILVDPYSVDDIVKGMLEILPSRGQENSKSKVQNLRKAGFENLKRFSWEKCAKETLGVLENI